MHKILLGLMLGLTPMLVNAADVPTPAEAKKVLDYIYNGKGQPPVLVEIKLCRDVPKDGENKGNCVDEVTGPLKKGESAYAWLLFMAADGDEAKKATVTFETGGAAKATKSVSVPGQQRSRTWYKNTFGAAGAWKIKVSLDGGAELGSRDVTVQ